MTLTILRIIVFLKTIRIFIYRIICQMGVTIFEIRFGVGMGGKSGEAVVVEVDC